MGVAHGFQLRAHLSSSKKIDQLPLIPRTKRNCVEIERCHRSFNLQTVKCVGYFMEERKGVPEAAFHRCKFLNRDRRCI